MKKKNLIKILAGVVLFFCIAYLAYDAYFRLPVEKAQSPAADPQEGEKTDTSGFRVLLLGLDGRAGLNDRTDTIILVSVDSLTEEVKVLSIPRDTRVKIKGSWNKINAAYVYGGVDLTKKTVSELLGVTVDRYAVTDFTGLVEIVDYIGGIEVDVPVRMYVPLEDIDLQPGLQHLNGEQVLAYSRYRGTIEGDIGRIERQQQVLRLLAEKMLSVKNIPRLPRIISYIKEEIATDLTVREMVALARLAPDALRRGVTMRLLPGKNLKQNGIWYWQPDLSKLE